MTITFSEENRNLRMNLSLAEIMFSFQRLGNKSTSYFRLEHEFVGYVQCFGKKGKLTIEYRTYETSGDEHFTLGQSQKKQGIQIIEGGNGNYVPVFSDEVLHLSDVKKVFKEFFEKYAIPNSYKLRDWRWNSLLMLSTEES
jgi:hypothetical protein